ncbi:hypothetical protein [Streptomyces sp. NPDC021356]|uniref:hypothetical protein n=1 Tax=Streptomyces sp. NPDC021356 TaxID=3154900 RepID=UPI0033C37D6C
MAEIIDYGRFRERLESVRPAGEADMAGTGARWELLREFQEQWGYMPTGGERWEREAPDLHKEYLAGLKAAHPGEPEDDRPESVDPRIPVPAALDEWWNLPFNSFADRSELYETNPEWPPTVRPDPGGYGVSDGLPSDNPFTEPDEDPRVCVFMAENQYCNEWGYPAARAHLADPPVLVSALGDDGEEGWIRQAHSVSEFFLLLALVRLLPHYGWTVEDDEPGEELLARVREKLTPLGFEPWREMTCRSEYYGGLDVIVCHDPQSDYLSELTVYGRTREALEHLAQTLGVDWSEDVCGPESGHR